VSRAARMRPRPEQDLLLRAALLPDPAQAAEAYARWTARVDLDRLDFGSLQLLPLLAQRPGGVPGDDDTLGRQVRHVARFSWLRTQMLGRRVAPVIAALEDAGLEPLLSKGAALVYAHGADARLRPMFDIDVAVAPDHADRAVAVLNALGYHSILQDALTGHRAAVVRDSHGFGFSGPDGAEIDLHWHLLHQGRSTALSEAFRAAAVEAEIAGVRCRATSVEDTLVVAVAHGTSWARNAAVRWVGDVALLLRDHGAALDWDAVVLRCRQARLSRAMLDGLDYVAEVSGLDAPAAARRELERVPVPLAVRLRRRRADDPGADGGAQPAGRIGGLVDAYENEVQSVVAPGARTGPADGLRFLARRWALPSVRAVPAHAAWVALGRPDGLCPGRLMGTSTEGGASASALPLGGQTPQRKCDKCDDSRYPLGGVLRFALGGEGHRFLGAGWWFPETHGVWSRSGRATVVLPLEATAPGSSEPLWLDLLVHAPLGPRRPSAAVRVVVNGRTVARTTLREHGGGQEIRARVPTAARAGRKTIEVALIVDRTIAPADARLNTDVRQLGIGLVALRLSADEARAPLAATG
jgi:putative nucleotidyltransferase-like protein